jgi:hypothetical protein
LLEWTKLVVGKGGDAPGEEQLTTKVENQTLVKKVILN